VVQRIQAAADPAHNNDHRRPRRHAASNPPDASASMVATVPLLRFPRLLCPLSGGQFADTRPVGPVFGQRAQRFIEFVARCRVPVTTVANHARKLA